MHARADRRALLCDIRGILPEEPGSQEPGPGGIHKITTRFQADPVHEAE